MKKKTVTKKCNFKMSVNKTCIFSGSKLPRDKMLLFFNMYFTIAPPRQQLMTTEFTMSTATYQRLASYCRKVRTPM
jgi:hypothetical protein